LGRVAFRATAAAAAAAAAAAGHGKCCCCHLHGLYPVLLLFLPLFLVHLTLITDTAVAPPPAAAAATAAVAAAAAAATTTADAAAATAAATAAAAAAGVATRPCRLLLLFFLLLLLLLLFDGASLCPSEPVKVGAFLEALKEEGFGEASEGGRVQVRGAGEGMQDGEGRGGTGVHAHSWWLREGMGAGACAVGGEWRCALVDENYVVRAVRSGLGARISRGG